MAKKNVNATIKTENEVYKLIKMILILVVLFLVFYMITYFVTKNQKNNVDNIVNDRIAAIQYDKILVGTMLNQKRNEYYVLLDKQDSDDYKLVSLYIDAYSNKEGALKVFTIDMNDPLNKSYYKNDVNITDDLDSFSINEITLIKVKDGNIISSYQGKDDVIKIVKEITE